MTERSVGRTVRTWRKQRSLSLTAAGALIGFSGAKLSLMENALHPTDPTEVIALALIYRVNSATWKPIARQAAGDFVINAAEDVRDVHPEVSILREFGGDGLPPLHRSPEYTARLASADEPLQSEILVSEDAVRQAAGKRSESVHLMNIVRLAESGRISVRVLRCHTDEMPQATESFAVLSFRHPQHDDVVFVERPCSNSYIEDPVACQLLLQGFEALKRATSGAEESTDFIAELVEGRLG